MRSKEDKLKGFAFCGFCGLIFIVMGIIFILIIDPYKKPSLSDCFLFGECGPIPKSNAEMFGEAVIGVMFIIFGSLVLIIPIIVTVVHRLQRPISEEEKEKVRERLQRKEVTYEEYKKEMGVSQKEQEALELPSFVPIVLVKNLEEVDEIIKKKEYLNAKHKLEDIIHDAKQYHLYSLENSAKEKYNLYKKYWKPKTT